MRLCEIASTNDLRPVAEFMVQHCQPWMSEAIYYNPFYRGVYTAGSTSIPDVAKEVAFVRPVRSDRTPTDSSRVVHDLFNYLIAAAGGVANRSNSAFVTSSQHTAKDYGNDVRVFVPIGPFNYTFHRHWNDWYSQGHTDRKLIEDYFNWDRVTEYFISKHPNTPIPASIQNKVLHNAYINWFNGVVDISYFDGTAHFPIMGDDATNRKTWKVNKFAKDLACDHSLRWAATTPTRPEVMISAKSGLYINPDVYESVVKLARELNL